MKKQAIILLSAALLLGSCGSYNTNEGLYAGATFGHVIGSAIGGLAGGPRGHEWGSLIGTIGGAAAGAAIGSATDKAQQRDRAQARQQRSQRQRSNRSYNDDYNNGYNNGYSQDDSGFDPQGRGNDIITFDGEGGAADNYQGGSTGSYYNDNPVANAPASMRIANAPALEIRNARILEAQRDGVLTRGEECRVVFEILNNSDHPVFNVNPFVEDATGNRHVKISQNLNIESIAPHQGVRYTASILADNRLKDGEIVVRLGVAQGRREVTSQTRLFNVPTAKRK